MKCKKARRLLPLAAGGDLAQPAADKVTAHLEGCEGCRRDYQANLQALQMSREWLARERKDWEEADWMRAIQRALQVDQAKPHLLASRYFKRGWAYAFLAAAAVMLCFLLIQPPFQKHRPEGRSQTQPAGGQEVISMTLVSEETGLKINWFFHKNFYWEEKK